MIKRTSLNLDLDLVAQARDVLDTRTTTETIHRALDEVVRRQAMKSLARGGRLVTCGATTGPEAPTDIRYIFGRQLSIHGTWLGAKRDLHELLPLVAAGKLSPIVHTVLPLAQAAEAHQIMERREQFGKIVLVP